MGSYNTVTFRCPKCGQRIKEQSKAGSCFFKTDIIHEAELADVAEIAERSARQKIICPKCGVKIGIIVRYLVCIDEYLDPAEEDDDET
jgi:predicted RNA-binding Zn-ribbon protein involved in translation (DUF1610 family)